MPRARAARGSQSRAKEPLRTSVSNAPPPRPPTEPSVALITDTLKKIQDGASLTGPFVEKLSDAYRLLNQAKRQVFQNKIVLEVKRCLAFLHEINKSKKGKGFNTDSDVEKILAFIIDLLRGINQVELERENVMQDSNLSSTVIETESLVSTVLESLVQTIDAKSPVIKFQSCELVGTILHSLSEEAEIMEYLIEKLIQKLLDRARDRSPDIRCAALRSLNRLQDYKNPEDEVIKLYCLVMQTDENEQCRKVATSLCGLNRHTLLRILDRCQDVSGTVRVTAYKRIAGKVKLSVLKHDQVLNLIERGLADPDEEVRSVLTDNLIPAWLQHIKNKDGQQGGLVDFVAMIDPTTSLSTTKKTIECILAQWADLNELMNHCLAPHQNLVDENMLPVCSYDYGPAVTFSWFHLYDYIRAKDVDVLKDFLPGLPSFCELIMSQIEDLDKLTRSSMQSQDDSDDMTDQIIKQENLLFMINWMLKGIQFFDVFDPTSRSKLHELAHQLLLKIPLEMFHQLSSNVFEVAKKLGEIERKKVADIIKEWVELLREGEPKPTSDNDNRERLDATGGSEEQEVPIEVQIKLAELEMKLSGLVEDIEIAFELRDFQEAQKLSDKQKEIEKEIADIRAEKIEKKKLPPTDDVNEEGAQPQTDQAFTQDSASKALILLIEHLKTKRSNFEIGLEQFIKILIVPVLPGIVNLTKDNLTILEESAIHCLGLFASLDEDIAKQYVPILVLFAENESGEINEKTQEYALKALGDLALVYESSLTDDLSVVCLQDASQNKESNATLGASGMSDLSNSIKDNGLQTTAAKIMVKITKNLEVGDDVRVAALEGICRLLLSGRSSVALLASLILFILQRDAEKKDSSKYKRVVHILMLSKQTHAILDDAFKSTIMVLLMTDDSEIEFEKAIEYFAKISNPEAITKVLKQHSPEKEISDEIYVLPLKLVCKALDLLQSYPDHHLAFTVCKTLEWFNIRPSIQKPFDNFHSEVGQSCKDNVYLCEELIEKCRNVIRERRTVKVLETFRELIIESVNLLRRHEQHEVEAQSRRKSDRRQSNDQSKKRPASVSDSEGTQSDNSTIIANEEPSTDDK